jgi:cell division protein FtsQ
MARKKIKKKNRRRVQKVVLDFESFKRILIFGLGGGCLMGLLILGGHYLVNHPPRLFEIREIIVANNTAHLSELDILKLTEVKVGDDLMGLSLEDLKKKMERYLWIKQVHLLKRYPHRLYVKVEEHQPMALVGLKELYLVNQDGNIFKKAASTDPRNLPVITGIDENDFKKNSKHAQYLLQQALHLIRRALQEEVIENYGISEVNWTQKDGFILYTMRPATQIKIGKLDFEKKFKRFAKAWPFISITSKEPKIVDLTYERRIIVRFKAT